MLSPRSARDTANDADASDDAALLERLRAGEHAAFAALVRRHAERFYRVAYRFTGNRAEAEDAVQEAFIALWEKPDRWNPQRNSAFTTWFYRVVVNRCLDRRKKPDRRAAHLSLADTEDMLPDRRPGQDETLAEGQVQVRLESAIAALPERQRTALNLCFYEELSNQEAAEIMGVRLKALQSLLMRAKSTLKAHMQAYL